MSSNTIETDSVYAVYRWTRAVEKWVLVAVLRDYVPTHVMLAYMSNPFYDVRVLNA